MKIKALPAFSLVVLAGTPLLAQSATLRVPQNYPTIQAAIDVAADGDVVRVAAGTYIENLVIASKAISLIGAGAETTIIDGDRVDRVITISQVAAGNVTIAGFTIQRGRTRLEDDQSQGGGIYGSEVVSLIVRDNVITDNQACTGAALALDSGTIRMLRNRVLFPPQELECGPTDAISLDVTGDNYIERNVIADHAGGGGNLRQNDGEGRALYIRHNVFRNNGSPNTSPGGLFASGDLVVDHNLFANNIGAGIAGASFEQVHESGGFIRNNSFSGNEANLFGTSGMRIRVADDSSVAVTNNLMSDYQAQEWTEIECENVPVVINNTNVFASERSTPIGGTCTP